MLLRQRGERFACLTFRKVANWYCRVLRPGREVQQRLVRLESVGEFDDVVAGLRRRDGAGWVPGEAEIAVPQGPVERW